MFQASEVQESEVFSMKVVKGWLAGRRYACSCGYSGTFRSSVGGCPYCPTCGRPGRLMPSVSVPRGLKSPVRKFKWNCSVCGQASAGKMCWKHSAEKRMAEWEAKRPKRSSRNAKPVGWVLPPNRRAALRTHAYWARWGVVEDGVYLGLLGDIKAKVREATKMEVKRNGYRGESVRKAGC